MDDSNSEDAPDLRPSDGDRIRLNVGGRLFETTVSTLRSGGPDSLLWALSNRPISSDPIFIDRDPDAFSALLSLLRSGRLPSSSTLHRHYLSDEASFYGLDHLLRSSLSPPPLLGTDASIVTTLSPSSDALPSALSASGGVSSSDGSVWIAHGGQVSAYDWSLLHSATVRTHLEEISAIRRVRPDFAAVASSDAPGLHFYSLYGGRHAGSAQWSDPSDPRVHKATVVAIAPDDDPFGPTIFASFECPHRENSIAAVDRSTLTISSLIGRQSGGSAKTAVPGKLRHLPEKNLIFSVAISSGAFGYSGYVRLWDVRSGDAVWETSEPGSGRSSRFGDTFADVDVDTDEAAMFKVCSKSGDVAIADLRMLGEDPWVYLEEANPVLRGVSGGGGGGATTVLHCYQRQLFVSREGALGVWSQVEEDREKRVTERTFRKNWVDKEGDSDRGVIRLMEGGGNRLFVCREGVEGVEVWESSESSGVVFIS
ncbi:BTB/POZ domain-containing protein [Acorus gramineus]|uniref:BTB/POZ domain-containing protein n=1 Tax=Acorus gramineus TaxID=55184 RepID=A0AAV9B2C1_ACOGR|nr:BTB/POZ domain-containing protein [Acorus gramineus]